AVVAGPWRAGAADEGAARRRAAVLGGRRRRRPVQGQVQGGGGHGFSRQGALAAGIDGADLVVVGGAAAHRGVGERRGRDPGRDGRAGFAAGAGPAVDVVTDGPRRRRPREDVGADVGRYRDAGRRQRHGGDVGAGEVVVARDVVGEDVVLVERAGADVGVAPRVGAGRRGVHVGQKGVNRETAVVDRAQDLVALGLLAGVVGPAQVDLR